MAEVAMQLPLIGNHLTRSARTLPSQELGWLCGQWMLPYPLVLCFLCYFLHSVKGGGQSHPPSLEMWRPGEVHKAGSDLAQVP